MGGKDVGFRLLEDITQAAKQTSNGNAGKDLTQLTMKDRRLLNNGFIQRHCKTRTCVCNQGDSRNPQRRTC